MKYNALRSMCTVVLLLIALAILAAPAWAQNPKLTPDGSTVSCSGFLVAVSERYEGSIRWVRVEDIDRTFGILVWAGGLFPDVGHGISNITGTMYTTASGERYIKGFGTDMDDGFHYSLPPFRLNGRAIGGGDWNYNSLTEAGQQGPAGGVGLNNVGMLVEVVGEVASYDSSTWTVWLDDTPNDANDPYIPVIQYPGTLTTSQWEAAMSVLTSVRVTGSVTLRTIGGVKTACVESRGWTDFEQEPSSTSYTIPTDAIDGNNNLIAIPYQAVNPEPAAVLNIPWYTLDDCLTGWNGNTQGNTIYDPEWGGELASLEIGNGYWLNMAGTSTSYDGYESIMPTWVSTPTTGWHIIGTPSLTAINWADVKVTNGSVVKTMEEARDAGWVNSVAFGWEDDGLFNMGLESDWETINTRICLWSKRPNGGVFSLLLELFLKKNFNNVALASAEGGRSLSCCFNNTFCAEGASGRWQKVSLPTPLPLFARPQRGEGQGRKGIIYYVQSHNFKFPVNFYEMSFKFFNSCLQGINIYFKLVIFKFS